MAVDSDLFHIEPDFEVQQAPAQRTMNKKQGTPLPADFTPGNYDVVCAKGKAVHQHVGNRRFRVICRMHLDKYSAAKTKQEKSRIVTTILDTIQQSCGEQGGFVKLDPLTGNWFEVSTHHAREKIGQTLRDSLHTKYSSSTKAKKHRRQAEKAKARSMSMESQREELPMPSTLRAFAAAQQAVQQAEQQQQAAPTTHLSNVQELLRKQRALADQARSSSSLRRSTSSALLDIFFDDKHIETLKEINDGEINPTFAAQLSDPTPNCYRGKAA